GHYSEWPKVADAVIKAGTRSSRRRADSTACEDPRRGVVYLCAAGNADGPVRSRSRRVNQPALTSQIRVSEPDVTLFNCLRAHMGRSTPRSSPSSATYTLCGCGHGGTRNSSTSRNVQT